MKTSRVVIIAVSVTITLMLLSYIFGYTHGIHRVPTGGNVGRDTVWMEADTVNIPPVVNDSIKRDSIPYPVPVLVPVPGSNDTVHDTITAYVPIVQKLFSYPGKGDFWVSGFHTSIDSAVFYTQHHETVKYITQDPILPRFGGAVGVEYVIMGEKAYYKAYGEGSVRIGRNIRVYANGGVAACKGKYEPLFGAGVKYVF